MSIQSPTSYQQAPYQQAPYQQAPNQQPGGPSWLGIWAAVIGTAIAAVLVVLALALSHGHSAAPATPGAPTSVPAHPTAPVVPAHPTAPVVPPAHPTTPSSN
jgi:hypothetical protein